MIAGRHNLTRRSLLGATFGVPALGSSRGAAWADSASPWAHALAEFRRTEGLFPPRPRSCSTNLQYPPWRTSPPAPRPGAGPHRPFNEDRPHHDEEVATLIDAELCLAELKADGRRLMCGN